MMNLRQAVFILLLLPLTRAAAQNVPAATAPLPYTGFELPDVSGTLRFSLNASERYLLGYNGESDNTASASAGGSVAYLSSSPVNPFSAIYTGAFIQGGVYGPSHVLSSLSLSQVIDTGLWTFVAADSVNYSPGNPVTGLSGVPGLGDGNVPPLTGSTTGEGIQTVDVPLLSNRISGTASYHLTAATTVSATGGQTILRYVGVPGGSTTDENTVSYSADLRNQLDTFTSVGLVYSHSGFVYLADNFNVTSQTVSVTARRQLTPNLTVNGSIGPQFTSSSNSAIEPSAVSVAASGSVNYNASVLSTSIAASRGTSAGGGLVAGTINTSVSGNVNRQFGDFFHASANAGYNSFASLEPGIGAIHNLVAGVQFNRSIISHVSAFFSYTLQRQINQGTGISSLALAGTTQTLAFGITYSPGAINIGRQ